MFREALNKTLSHEGYYANVPGDKGGETYRGIARNFHPDWPGWPIIDKAKAKNGGALPWNHKINSHVLDEQVENLYLEKFWAPIHLDRVADASLRGFIFDFYVNSRRSGIRVVQHTLRERFGHALLIDGIMGMKTVDAVNNCEPQSLFKALKIARGRFYRKIARYGDNQKFLGGWLNRLDSFHYEA